MPQAMSVLPLWGILAAVFLTALALGLRIVVQRRVGIRRSEPGFMLGGVGVVSAVTLTFVLIAACEELGEARTSVARESGAAAALFHYGEAAVSEAAKLPERIVDDLRVTTGKNWPVMAVDRASAETARALDGIYGAAMAFQRTGTGSVADMPAVLPRIDNLPLAGGLGLPAAASVVPAAGWLALIAGAGLTVLFTMFLGGPDGLAEIAVIAALSLLVTSDVAGVIFLAHEALERVLVRAEIG